MTFGSVDPQSGSSSSTLAVREGQGVVVVCVGCRRLDRDVVSEVSSLVDATARPVVVDCVAVREVEEPALTELDRIARARDDVVLRRVPGELRAALAARGLVGLVAYAER